MRSKLLKVLVGAIILAWLGLLPISCYRNHEVESMMKTKLGWRVIIDKDTLTIIDYTRPGFMAGKEDYKFILSNGTKLSTTAYSILPMLGPVNPTTSNSN